MRENKNKASVIKLIAFFHTRYIFRQNAVVAIYQKEFFFK